MSTTPVTRRDFLKLAGAASALATGACTAPPDEIVPYVKPRAIADGIAQFYATAMTMQGRAVGLLVQSDMGRPTKIEGNPAHPSSLGSTGAFEQASILELWDPARSRTLRHRGVPATREALAAEWRRTLAALEARDGEGLRILTGYVGSATLRAQLAGIAKKHPAMRLHEWEPLHRDNSLEGARLAFGRRVDCAYRFEAADVVVAIDADPLGAGPGWVRHARDFASRRAPQSMGRLYAIETFPSITGSMADHRVALAPAAIRQWLLGLDAALRGETSTALPLVMAAARDLLAHRGRALVIAGESLPPAAHAIVHRMNARLGAPGNTVSYLPPVSGVACAESIKTLSEDMRAGRVRALLVLGGNPAYDAPSDYDFSGALAKVPMSAHVSLYEDETSAACAWHVPRAHYLEEWSDATAHDGTASIVQPLVAPLYGGISVHEAAAMLEDESASPRELVMRALRLEGDAWRTALRDGVVASSAPTPLALAARDVAFTPVDASGWTAAFRPDAAVHGGEFAPNAWLQELPRPESKLVWDNAAYVSPASASQLGVKNGDLIEVSVAGRKVRAPAWILTGHADGTITLPLGYGRERAGPVGSHVGFDAYPLRAAATPWDVACTVTREGGARALAATQLHTSMEGRDPAKRMTLADALSGHAAAHGEKPTESLYPAWPYESYRWAMAIDLNACIGCNACTVACQAENNIPTVGKEEASRGRSMHWIRVDRYEEGGAVLHQPVPCMQCEDAPCEAVCPVGATVHDSEGINVQVYNRCVGTRFCSNNCPYKVRRFNFFHYSAGPGERPVEGSNPQVTTRMRGVMEKCNYCLQRITRARLQADKEDRRIAEGDVVTACQAACPTKAITFGDMADPASAVAQVKRSPRGYTLLEELNTRPRTTYLARVANPNPEAGP
ncbi:MAG TPA: 4Fe-4S dicluster domain-containing protein [Usitatibacter sp.]|nr:4Fe-4S dicluster domain-containing protein [Usitatibacter sp.]